MCGWRCFSLNCSFIASCVVKVSNISFFSRGEVTAALVGLCGSFLLWGSVAASDPAEPQKKRLLNVSRRRRSRASLKTHVSHILSFIPHTGYKQNLSVIGLVRAGLQSSAAPLPVLDFQNLFAPSCGTPHFPPFVSSAASCCCHDFLKLCVLLRGFAAEVNLRGHKGIEVFLWLLCIFMV